MWVYLERGVYKIIPPHHFTCENVHSPVNRMRKLGYFLFPVSAEKANSSPKSKHEMGRALDLSEQQESNLFFPRVPSFSFKHSSPWSKSLSIPAPHEVMVLVSLNSHQLKFTKVYMLMIFPAAAFQPIYPWVHIGEKLRGRATHCTSKEQNITSTPVFCVSLGGSSLTGMTVTEIVTGRLRRSIS